MVSVSLIVKNYSHILIILFLLFHCYNFYLYYIITIFSYYNFYIKVYRKELEIKAEHQEHMSLFLNLIKLTKIKIFIYNLFDKRDEFPFFIVRRLQHTQLYIS